MTAASEIVAQATAVNLTAAAAAAAEVTESAAFEAILELTTALATV